jgi:hypothetical protein
MIATFQRQRARAKAARLALDAKTPTAAPVEASEPPPAPAAKSEPAPPAAPRATPAAGPQHHARRKA